MRDILVLTIVFASLPVSFLRPWIGVLVFAWISYMNPHRYAWGIATTFPVALLVALATIAGLAFTRDRGPFPRRPEVLMLIALWGWFFFTTILAVNPDGAWPQWEKVSKILIMTFVTMLVINSQEKLRYLLLTISLSVGLIGLKGGVFTVLTGGRHHIFGPSGSFLADNNDLAHALNMTLPLLLYLAKDEPRRWLRLTLQACLVMSIVSVIFTFSRGGLVALVAVVCLLLVKARRKSLAVLVVAVAVVTALWVVPEKWVTRMETIGEYEQDASVTRRLNAWKMAWNLALDRPITGGGFETFTCAMFRIYAPNPDDCRDVHSVYFELLGEHGFPALGLFLLLNASLLLTLAAAKRQIKRDPALGWGRHYPDMLQVSVVAYLAGGAFLGRAYFDLYYHVLAAAIILKSLCDRTSSAAPKAAPPATLTEPHLRMLR